MKRLIIATAIMLSTPALAEVGKPFEQLDLDRALPSTPDNVAVYERIPAERMPFEQTMLDRAILGEPEPERVQVAQLGSASYKSGEDSESSDKNPWANDHNFIAPAP
jgi:hypothetical protein